MKKANIIFHQCIQDSQDYGSDDEHMISRVFFSLNIGDKKYSNLHVDIKQAVGSDYETGPIEVGVPEGYKGPFNYHAFRDGVEKYYRNLVGSGAKGIRIQGGANIRMRNNTFNQEMAIQCEIDEGAAGW
jgi:hypothetical protein